MHKQFEVYTNVPIYNQKLVLNLSNCPIKQIKKHKLFNQCVVCERQDDKYDEEEDSSFCCQDDYGNFGLFYSSLFLSRGVIAHEIFHATHFVLQYIGDNFNTNNHEPYAYVNHWITEWVYVQLDKHNYRIKTNVSKKTIW